MGSATHLRGRRRDPSIDARVLQAAVEELAERGIAGFATNSVATRAGVDKRGIYARWPDRDRLVLDALGSLTAGLTVPATGELRSDLLAIVPAVAAVFTSPRIDILQRCVQEAQEYPAIYAAFRRDSIDRCMAVVEDVFRSAAGRGEIDGELDPVLAGEAFIGILLTRANFIGQAAISEPGQQRAIVEFVVRAVGSSKTERS
ncbi:TetR/AcrR family transcriptional regulator [Nocardia bovistercoris]|uniref:TetR/AcrR family transcriptional regulator n=1 Tax=Nocardia bovistercoris TaxID=2785916 RepID=A0A931IAN8_9NOCA|nr:TetR/AcrR family transcriptional regulator [Nocardia bovistercoris]MBH0777864.1 TetR/AcrR family transcriptional regulator [Nocardia bovistercoris]